MEMLLDVLGLTSAADRPFRGYSSGMRQKLAIARGLINEPRIVLYDEPTRSLDPLSARQIRNWIEENQVRSPHQTHLLATNQLQEAEQLAHRVIVISHGSVIALGTIQQIRDEWRKHDYTVHRITCRNLNANETLRPAPELGLLDIVTEAADSDFLSLRIHARKDSEALHHVLAAIVAGGGKILQCESEQVSFDRIFCDLVTGDRADTTTEIPGVLS